MEVWSISNFPFLIKGQIHIGMIPSSGSHLKGTETIWEDFLFLFKIFLSAEEKKFTDSILFLFFCKNMEK